MLIEHSMLKIAKRMKLTLASVAVWMMMPKTKKFLRLYFHLLAKSGTVRSGKTNLTCYRSGVQKIEVYDQHFVQAMDYHLNHVPRDRCPRKVPESMVGEMKFMLAKNG